MIQIERRVGKERFPLIEQSYYPNHKEMVSNLWVSWPHVSLFSFHSLHPAAPRGSQRCSHLTNCADYLTFSTSDGVQVIFSHRWSRPKRKIFFPTLKRKLVRGKQCECNSVVACFQTLYFLTICLLSIGLIQGAILN